jgi:hypothetical protein
LKLATPGVRFQAFIINLGGSLRTALNIAQKSHRLVLSGLNLLARESLHTATVERNEKS